MSKTVENYIKLPYTVEIIPNEDGTFFAQVKEFPGCMSEGDTFEDAFKMIRDAMHSWLEVALKEGRDIPLPEAQIKKKYSGKFVVRIPHELHRALSLNAVKNGVSLNQYVNNLLVEKNSRLEMMDIFVEMLSLQLHAYKTYFKGSILPEKFLPPRYQFSPKLKINAGRS